MSDTKRKRALLLYGGWEGHRPETFADFAEERLLCDFDVVRSQDLEMLRYEALREFDLVLPIWTFGELSEEQLQGLLQAMREGLGMVAWHGNASAFLERRAHKLLLGGQFVGHPGGSEIEYQVHFLANDPLVEGLEDVTVVSEQYYLLIDPAVKVLATSRIHGGEMDWVAGVQMPVAWKRSWRLGRVFYCALGHTVDVLEHPAIAEMLSRAVKWAVRGSQKAY